MNKQLLIVILISLLIILVPASIISLGLWLFLGNYIQWLLISAGAIFVIGQLSNQYFMRRIELDINNFKAKIEELRSAQSVEASCAYCKTRMSIPVKLSERITHACPDCKQINLVVFQFTTAQISTPMDLPQLGQPVTVTSPEVDVVPIDNPETPSENPAS